MNSSPGSLGQVSPKYLSPSLTNLSPSLSKHANSSPVIHSRSSSRRPNPKTFIGFELKLYINDKDLVLGHVEEWQALTQTFSIALDNGTTRDLSLAELLKLHPKPKGSLSSISVSNKMLPTRFVNKTSSTSPSSAPVVSSQAPSPGSSFLVTTGHTSVISKVDPKSTKKKVLPKKTSTKKKIHSTAKTSLDDIFDKSNDISISSNSNSSGSSSSSGGGGGGGSSSKSDIGGNTTATTATTTTNNSSKNKNKTLSKGRGVKRGRSVTEAEQNQLHCQTNDNDGVERAISAVLRRSSTMMESTQGGRDLSHTSLTHVLSDLRNLGNVENPKVENLVIVPIILVFIVTIIFICSFLL